MAVKTVQYIIDGQTYNLTFDASTGEYKATVPAPSKSSYSQDGHKYGGSVIATDDAGNSTTINQSDATLGANLLLRVLEKVAPTLAFTYPTAGAYITNATPAIRFKVTDSEHHLSQLASEASYLPDILGCKQPSGSNQGLVYHLSLLR